MTISENWMLNEVYHMCKEILKRLDKLEGKNEEENSEKPKKT